ncbi:MAG: hypothetical protein OEL53_03670 [Rhodospirillales bacterium]|nr:hypothetical protein [Rhodospirillales bacterium]
MTFRLPNAHQAIIEDNKIILYLLSDTHPAGRAKAAYFKNFGFGADEWERLRQALLDHAGTGLIVTKAETKFGMKYIVEGELLCPDGRKPVLHAVWFVASGDNKPRLVTAYPVRRG